MEKLNLMIVDDNPLVLGKLRELFRSEERFTVVGTASNGEDAIHMIKENMPDIVLLDLVMPKIDGISVVEQIKEQMAPNDHPVFIMFSGASQEHIVADAFRAGVSYYILKPFDLRLLVNKVHYLGERISRTGETKLLRSQTAVNGNPDDFITREDSLKLRLELDVTEVLHELGVPAHINGFAFLRDSIIIVVNDRTMLESVTKILYPAVAKMNHTTSTRVERGIRHAIEVVWNKGNKEIIEEIFGYTISHTTEKPTNSEFIAMLADRIAMAEGL